MAKFNKTPYTVNVFDLIHRPGESREIDLDVVVPEQLGEGLVSVSAGQNIDVHLRLESLGEGILATAELETIATGECGRCLEPMAMPLELEFQELFAYPEEEAFDYEVHDDHVDLEPLIRDAVVLALPFQPVCRPDCPGLDPKTGERLEAPLESPLTETVDPRWAELKKLGASEDPGVETPDTK